MDLQRAHTFCMRNREMLQGDKKCGCFYCRRIYDPKEITQWIDEGETARCPYCGIDAVLSESAGYPLNAEFLDAMYERWFGTVMKL